MVGRFDAAGVLLEGYECGSIREGLVLRATFLHDVSVEEAAAYTANAKNVLSHGDFFSTQ